MKRRSLLKFIGPALASASPVRLYAEVYLSTDQAKALLCPKQSLTAQAITLSEAEKKAIEKASGVRVREIKLNVFRGSGGSWLFLDTVLGKHEFINYAVALSGDGSVTGVEILTYRESYGHEIKNPQWRAQLNGKNAGSALKLDQDVKNVSGATLSCSHITEGVRRIVHTFAIAVKGK